MARSMVAQSIANTPHLAPYVPLLYIHMPKSAGTSLQRTINEIYKGRTVRYLEGAPPQVADFIAEPESVRHGVDVLCGHLVYQLVQSMRPSTRVITMLREPVDRYISMYHYIRQTPHHRLHAIASELSLEAFIGHPWAPEADNDHVRRLSSIGHWTGPVGSVTEEMLASAKANLAQSIFGLAERYDESIAHFARRLAWPDTPRERLNVTPNRPLRNELPPDVTDRVREANRYDVNLYDFALALFEKRLRCAPDTP